MMLWITLKRLGKENIADVGSPGLEESIIAEELRSRVRHAVAALPKAERELIQAIYYEGLSERVYAKQHGISQRGANKQRRKILSKLKMFLGQYRTEKGAKYRRV